MRHRFKSTIQGIVCAGFLALAAPGNAAEKITLNDNPYPSFQALMHLLIVLFEEKLGYVVETKPADNAVTYAGMHAGEGDIDIHVDAWLPNQKDFHQKYVVEEGTVVYSEKHYAGSSGFCVPDYFAEEHNVKSIFDLARPEVSQQLDSDGDGKGEIWIGTVGVDRHQREHDQDSGLRASRQQRVGEDGSRRPLRGARRRGQEAQRVCRLLLEAGFGLAGIWPGAARRAPERRQGLLEAGHAGRKTRTGSRIRRSPAPARRSRSSSPGPGAWRSALRSPRNCWPTSRSTSIW